MSLIERAVSRLGDESTSVRGSVTDLSAYAGRPASRARRPVPADASPLQYESPKEAEARDTAAPRPAAPRRASRAAAAAHPDGPSHSSRQPLCCRPA